MLKSKLIGAYYRNIMKPILFLQDPEKVHDRFSALGNRLGRYSLTQYLTRKLFNYEHPALKQKVSGITFKNPVGLSAGFDKDAKLTQILPDVGFSFMQIGSVTAKPYGGNPKPRLIRLKKSRALVVYYGLKNIGIHAILKNMKLLKKRFPLSFSVAKTNCDATAETNDGIKDYCESLKAIEKAKAADFYTINISCPNTFGGEPFTDAARLTKLLSAIKKLKLSKPIYLKMPINTEWKEFKGLCDVALAHGIEGLIIGNLQKDKKDKSIIDPISPETKGGISGKPTEKRCNSLISKTYKEYGDKFVIVGVGGIFSADDAYEKIRRGATLVQLITGMIFQGPQLIGEINEGLVKRLKKDGFKNISEAVGSAHK